MTDEITPEPTPEEPPAVSMDAVPDMREVMPDIFDTAKISGVASIPDSEPDFTYPEFRDAAAPPFAQVPAEQLAGNMSILLIRVDELTKKVDDLTGRIDWIATRVDWIQRTFNGLIEQFGKISPGQLFSMLRGKTPPQGGIQS